MTHVPDVGATVDWYRGIGFELVASGDDSGELVWAEMSFGDGRVMFSAGGHPRPDERREVDLYVQTVGIDELFRKLKPVVRLQEGVHDTFYGMREFIVRDNNGFWIRVRQRRGGGLTVRQSSVETSSRWSRSSPSRFHDSAY
jgi:uncharacterized glyoxalase superfamily protein PhnB